MVKCAIAFKASIGSAHVTFIHILLTDQITCPCLTSKRIRKHIFILCLLGRQSLHIAIKSDLHGLSFAWPAGIQSKPSSRSARAARKGGYGYTCCPQAFDDYLTLQLHVLLPHWFAPLWSPNLPASSTTDPPLLLIWNCLLPWTSRCSSNLKQSC